MVLWQLLGVNITPSYFQFYRKFLNVMGKKKNKTQKGTGDAVLRQNVCLVLQGQKKTGNRKRGGGKRREAGRERKEAGRGRVRERRGKGKGRRD